MPTWTAWQQGGSNKGEPGPCQQLLCQGRGPSEGRCLEALEGCVCSQHLQRPRPGGSLVKSQKPDVGHIDNRLCSEKQNNRQRQRGKQLAWNCSPTRILQAGRSEGRGPGWVLTSYTCAHLLQKAGRDPSQGPGFSRERQWGHSGPRVTAGPQLIIYLGDPCAPLAAEGHSPLAEAQSGKELSSQGPPHVPGKWG